MDVRPADELDVFDRLLGGGYFGHAGVLVSVGADLVQEDYFVLVCGDFDVLYGYFGRARGGFRRRVVGLGRHFWILPNIASDEIPINEVFSPMWMFDDLDASGNVVGKIGIVQRILGTGILSGSVGRGV